MFIFKQKTLKAQLPKNMTDIHSHLLPGVDDGIRTMEDSVAALEYLHEIGVKRICLTPHIMEDLPNNTPENLQARFQELKATASVRPELNLAAEYMLDAAFKEKLNDELLTMPEKHVLVETSASTPPPGLADILYDLALSGYIPVIAHPERYNYMQPKEYGKMKEKEYKLQLNLFSLTGYYGLMPQKKAVDLLKNGLYDFVGTDIHQLKVFQRALENLSLSSSQMQEIERLSSNNEALFA
ncbi:MAG: hypothetical protein LBH04_09450 [Tannerellaceae bacterium]|jgi:tyrosine-protein phosphatase YwqE|nr:hypothetical protein [Tannerellaceae bacterium]